MNIIANILSSTKQIKLIRKKEFVATTFNLKDKTFIIYVISFINLNLSKEVYSFCQIQIASLKVNKVFIVILFKYTDFTNIYVSDFVVKL